MVVVGSCVTCGALGIVHVLEGLLRVFAVVCRVLLGMRASYACRGSNLWDGTKAGCVTAGGQVVPSRVYFCCMLSCSRETTRASWIRRSVEGINTVFSMFAHNKSGTVTAVSAMLAAAKRRRTSLVFFVVVL